LSRPASICPEKYDLCCLFRVVRVFRGFILGGLCPLRLD
jgi:hypothetical protein